MICPECKLEMRNENAKIVFEGDDSPDTPTKAFMVVTPVCRNKKCPAYGKEQEPIKTEMTL